MKDACPCCSGHTYAECCGRYHDGDLPTTALDLMRSRYSAYALGKVDYILSTTHPENPQYGQQWKDSVFEFCRDTRFIKLDILASAETTVKFAAHLIQRGKSFVLEEESLFQKENGKWLYLKALSSEAKSPDGKS